MMILAWEEKNKIVYPHKRRPTDQVMSSFDDFQWGGVELNFFFPLFFCGGFFMNPASYSMWHLGKWTNLKDLISFFTFKWMLVLFWEHESTKSPPKRNQNNILIMKWRRHVWSTSIGAYTRAKGAIKNTKESCIATTWCYYDDLTWREGEIENTKGK